MLWAGGAVTELLHVPALRRRSDVLVTVVADKNRERADKVAAMFDSACAVEDYGQLIGNVDAAIVAIPNRFHAPVARELLQNGVHVLLEKPMAITAEDCDSLNLAASQSQTVLAVGMVRRFLRATHLISELIESGAIGQVRRCEVSEGGVFDWPVASDALLRKDLSGGGTLIDVGVHVLDLLSHWLGSIQDVRYYDDAHGGIEADCRLELTLEDGAECLVELSRLRRMKGTYVFHGTSGRIDVGPGFNPEIRVTLRTCGISGQSFSVHSNDAAELNDAFDAQLDDFIGAVRKRTAPSVTGVEGRKTIDVIEACYRSRRELPHPWTRSKDAVTEPLAHARQALREEGARTWGYGFHRKPPGGEFGFGLRGPGSGARTQLCTRDQDRSPTSRNGRWRPNEARGLEECHGWL